MLRWAFPKLKENLWTAGSAFMNAKTLSGMGRRKEKD